MTESNIDELAKEYAKTLVITDDIKDDSVVYMAAQMAFKAGYQAKQSPADEKLDDAADTYSGVMVWVNPKELDPHLFHEYISKTSFIEGANWAAKQSQEQVGEWTNEEMLQAADTSLKKDWDEPKHEEIDEDWKAKYQKCIMIIKRFDPGIIGMYDL